MKQYILLLSALLSTNIFSMTSYATKEQCDQVVHNILNDHGALEQFRKLPKIERARLFALFQERDQEEFANRYISKQSVLNLMTRSKNQPGLELNSCDLYNAGLIYFNDGEENEALEFFKLSSEPEAYYMRAKMLLSRQFDEHELKAARWLLKSAERGGYTKATHALSALEQHVNAQKNTTTETFLANSDTKVSDSSVSINGTTTVEQSIDCLIQKKQLSNTEIKHLFKLVSILNRPETTRTIITDAKYLEQENAFFFVKYALKYLRKQQKIDMVAVTGLLISFYETVIKSDTARKNTQEMQHLINSIDFQCMQERVKEDEELTSAFALFFTLAGSHYFLPHLLEQTIVYASNGPETAKQQKTLAQLHKAIANIHGVEQHLDTMTVHLGKAYEHYKRAMELNALLADDFFLFVFDYIASIPTTDRAQLYEEAVNAAFAYAHQFHTSISSEKLFSIFTMASHGCEHKELGLHCGQNHIRTLEWGSCLLEKYAQEKATLENSSDTATRREHIKEREINICLDMVRSLCAVHASTKEYDPFILCLLKNDPLMAINLGIIFYENRKYDLAKDFLLDAIAFAPSHSQKTNFAHCVLAEMAAQKRDLATVLKHLSQLTSYEVLTITQKNNATVALLNLLREQTQTIVVKSKDEITKEDLLVCRYFGILVTQNKDHTVVKPLIGLGIKALYVATEQGDITSLQRMIECNNQSSAVSDALHSKFFDMLKKFKRKEFRLFKDTSTQELVNHLQEAIDLVIRSKFMRLPHLATIATFYQHDFNALLQTCNKQSFAENFNFYDAMCQIVGKSYDEFHNHLIAYCQERKNTIQTLSDEERTLLHEALIIQWSIQLSNTIKQGKDKFHLLREDMEQWSEILKFTPKMIDLYDAISFFILADFPPQRTEHMEAAYENVLQKLSESANLRQDKALKIGCLILKTRLPNTTSQLKYLEQIISLLDTQTLHNAPALKQHMLLLIADLCKEKRYSEIGQLLKKYAFTNDEQELLVLLEKHNSLITQHRTVASLKNAKTKIRDSSRLISKKISDMLEQTIIALNLSLIEVE